LRKSDNIQQKLVNLIADTPEPVEDIKKSSEVCKIRRARENRTDVGKTVLKGLSAAVSVKNANNSKLCIRETARENPGRFICSSYQVKGLEAEERAFEVFEDFHQPCGEAGAVGAVNYAVIVSDAQRADAACDDVVILIETRELLSAANTHDCNFRGVDDG
jgi:hypothetical protein